MDREAPGIHPEVLLAWLWSAMSSCSRCSSELVSARLSLLLLLQKLALSPNWSKCAWHSKLGAVTCL